MVSAILELSLRPEDKIDLIPGYRVKGCVRATGTAPAHRERSPTRPSARRSHRTDNAPARRATAPVLTPSGQRPCKIVQERLVPSIVCSFFYEHAAGTPRRDCAADRSLSAAPHYGNAPHGRRHHSGRRPARHHQPLGPWRVARRSAGRLLGPARAVALGALRPRS